MDTPDFFSESLSHWRYIRHLVIGEVENIPEDRFDFRPTPAVRSVEEMVQHILEVSMVMVGELTQDQPDFQRMSLEAFCGEYAGPARETRGKRELLSLLGSQLEEGIASFERVGAEAMMGPAKNFDGSVWSRMQWFFHGAAQEMYHGGQLATYTRLMGLVPALTQKIEAGGE